MSCRDLQQEKSREMQALIPKRQKRYKHDFVPPMKEGFTRYMKNHQVHWWIFILCGTWSVARLFVTFAILRSYYAVYERWGRTSLRRIWLQRLRRRYPLKNAGAGWIMSRGFVRSDATVFFFPEGEFFRKFSYFPVSSWKNRYIVIKYIIRLYNGGFPMNLWKDMNPSRISPQDFIAVIEISKGSKNKYELDKESGALILDRVLYTSTHYR